MADQLRFLVIDGYKKDGRDELAAYGVSGAADLYVNMLKQYEPDAHYDILFICDANASLPQGVGFEDYDGIAWTGSSLTIYDDTPEVTSQIELARKIFDEGVPSFGSCWAAQIAVVAAGGVVQANPRGREMGFARKIQLTPEGRAHPMYIGKPSVFEGIISHVDEVTHIPACGEMLACNNFTHVQAVSVTFGKGVFWGVQYHPEFNIYELARLTECRMDKLLDLGFFNNDRELGMDYVRKLEALHQDPGRKDIAWMYAIDEDVLDPNLRCTEAKNWIEQLVIPHAQRKR